MAKQTVYHFRGHKIKSITEIPQESHFAVIIDKKQSFHIPGDERSQTNPGHGYPERTESVEYFEYYVFKEDEQDKLQSLMGLLLNENPQRNDLKIIKVETIPHKVQLVVNLGVPKKEEFQNNSGDSNANDLVDG